MLDSARNPEIRFRPNLIFSDTPLLEARLGLRECRSRKAREMRSALLANLVYAATVNPSARVRYSRDRSSSDYAGAVAKRYAPPSFSYRAMMCAVGDVGDAGLIEERRTRPSSGYKRQSTLRASSKLQELASDVLKDLVVYRRVMEEIVLKDADKRLADYQDTPAIRAMREDVREQNRRLVEARIALDHPSATMLPFGLIRVEDRVFRTADLASARTFNEDFARGGRWYGLWVQSIPSDLRPYLTIDGEPTIERDFRCCHPRLLGAGAGIDLPFNDPDFDFYAVPGIDRRTAKRAVNVLLNANSDISAIRALAQELRERGIPEPFAEARRAVELTILAHSRLERFWGTGIGLRLQNIDAGICARVQQRLRDSMVCLSVHDSFIVQARHATRLATVMDTAFDEACFELRKAGLPV